MSLGYGNNTPNTPPGDNYRAPDYDPRCPECGFGLDEDGVCQDCALDVCPECGESKGAGDDICELCRTEVTGL